MIQCIYSIYHLSRPASGKTPGSSAAYHTFSGISDVCVLPLYTYGALNCRENGSTWENIITAQPGLVKYFVPTTLSSRRAVCTSSPWASPSGWESCSAASR
jgi:hypothetical protein